MHDKELYNFIKKETMWIINRQYKNKKRICPQCKDSFTRHTSMHFFCSSKCYSKYHRIPGMIRKLLKGGID